MSRVRFASLASEEVFEARAWYAARDRALSVRLRDAVRALRADLEAWPSSHQPYTLPPGYEKVEIRAAPVPGFPYRLIYQVTPTRIWVLACAHTSRKPTYWIDRILPPAPGPKP